MKSLHIISIGVISDKNLTQEEAASLVEALSFRYGFDKVCYFAEMSVEQQIESIMRAGVKDGVIGNAHIHIEQTEEEEKEPKDYNFGLAGHSVTNRNINREMNREEFTRWYKSHSYGEREKILKALSKLNK